MSAPVNLTEWMKGLPICWLVSNTVGAADATAQGTVYDGQVDLIKQAVEARFPDTTPVDGLPYVGDNFGLIQGKLESDDDFRERCRLAWDQWALTGTWAELLYQLYFTCGLTNFYTQIVQQNGLAYYLDVASLAVTDDPTAVLATTELGLNYNVGDFSGVPWWTFDTQDDMCARFAIIIGKPAWGATPGPLPPSIQITARATFTAESSVTADWSYPFDGPDYLTMFSVTPLDSSSPVVSVTAQDAATVTVTSSAPFTGYVDLIAWTADSNPFASPPQSLKNLIEVIANRWKPAKAKFMGTIVLVSGAVWGWPANLTWGASGLNWGDSLVEHL